MHWFVRLALLDFDMILIIGTRPEKLPGLSRGPRHRARGVCKTHTGWIPADGECGQKKCGLKATTTTKTSLIRFIICVPEVGFLKVLLYLNPDFSFEVTDAKNHTYI